MKKYLAMLLVVALMLSLAACSGNTTAPTETASTEASASTETAAPSVASESAVENADPNAADYTYVQKAGAPFDLIGYYANADFSECETIVRSTGGVVSVPDDPKTSIPKAKEKYTIGFSCYYTVDEVGAMILDNMKKYAEEAGVELLVNDANYDQNAQNQAVEQWVTQGVDGVIIAPCDFTGVQGALDSLKKANIPVVTLNAPLAGETDSVVMGECVEQGSLAAQILIDKLKASGSDMKGVITISTLNFVHPNAATREKGFRDAFKDYPDIEFVNLTGVSPEDHYAQFEGALASHGDNLIGAFGLYSSATIGLLNAAKANKSNVPITSIDNDKVILEAINNGEILGSCCYSSTTPAFWCMSAIVNKLNGVDIPGAYFYQNVNVTKDNVEEMFEHYYNGLTLAEYSSGQTEKK